jgi:hypothetical protein
VYSEYDPSVLEVSSNHVVEKANGSTWVRSSYNGKDATISVFASNITAAVHSITAHASSELDSRSFPASAVLDGNQESPWLSGWHSQANEQEWLELDLGAATDVTSIQLTPRSDKVCFPDDFKFQFSENGTDWSDIPGQSYTNQKQLNNNNKIDYVLDQTIHTRYIRLLVTKLTNDRGGNFGAHIADFGINQPKMTASASSSLSEGFPASNVLDGNQGSPWLSGWHGNANDTEWLAVNLGAKIEIHSIQVTPRSDGICFPDSFTFQSSDDGTIWSNIPGQSYTNQSLIAGNQTQDYFLANPISTKYVRMFITRLTNDGGGHYGAHVGDFSINHPVITDPLANIEAKNTNMKVPLTTNPIKLTIRSVSKKGMFTDITRSTELQLTGYNPDIIGIDENRNLLVKSAGFLKFSIFKPMSTSKMQGLTVESH